MSNISIMSDITMRRPIKWVSCAKTDVGTIRDVNEDSVLLKPENGLWVVADGMGGYDAGDIASSMIVNSLAETEYIESFNDFVDSIEDNLIEVNRQILEYSNIMLDQQTMGSTVVSLLIRGRVGACLWAGDSRLYRLRNNELQKLSRDHSQVEELKQQGFLKEEDVENHPDANIITRAVGACEDLYVDINIFNTQIGDTFLLCSDGLYNAVKNTDIFECLSLQNVEQSASQLLSLALGNNAADNVSLIISRGEADRIASKDLYIDE